MSRSGTCIYICTCVSLEKLLCVHLHVPVCVSVLLLVLVVLWERNVHVMTFHHELCGLLGLQLGRYMYMYMCVWMVRLQQ